MWWNVIKAAAVLPKEGQREQDRPVQTQLGQYGSQGQLTPQQAPVTNAPKPGEFTQDPTIEHTAGSVPQEHYEQMQPEQMPEVKPTMQQPMTATPQVAEDVAETDPSQFTQQTRQSMMRTASGQHSDLSTQIANISASARTNPTEQKKLLGRIRNLLREANIPETKVATGLPGDIQ